MEPLATCVVDNAIPRWLEERMITADEVSAAMPCGEPIRPGTGASGEPVEYSLDH
jgi:hypothetical protein